MYQIYKERYCKLVEMLDMFLPRNIIYSKPGGGLNIWLDFSYGFPVETLLKLSAADHVVFAPGRIFFSSADEKLNSLRLSFAATHTAQIEEGVKKFCKHIHALQNKQTEYKNMPIM